MVTILEEERAATDDAARPEEHDTLAEPSGTEIHPVSRRTEIMLGVGLLFPILGTAAMVGGVFTGVAPRAYAAIAGLLGLGLAAWTRRVGKPLQSNALVLAGLFGIGLLMALLSGPDNVFNLRKEVLAAVESGDVLRPPVPFVAGWRPIIGWLMGMVGFITGWVGLALEKPMRSILLPLPFAALVAFSVPKGAQIASGIGLLLSFVVGLRLVSLAVEGQEQGQSQPAAYHLRVALRALPLLAALTVGLYFLAQNDFLFPRPIIDPATEPQKPKTVPLSEAADRVLFEVESTISGPWRIGGLDVYDGTDWRLPPFADARLKQVPESGIVDPDLTANIEADFKVAGLTGAVLPGLPNTVGIEAEGPLLAYDSRNANIRFVQGQVTQGFEYRVVAPALPSVDNLQRTFTPPEEVREFTEIPDAPDAVKDLLSLAPKDNKWEEFDFLRNYILDNVVATGTGAPKSVTPDRVADMIAGSKKASPFEIVAAQAMLARWVNLPSRIGYGFDGGDEIGEGRFAVRPKHGATFVEVWFPQFKWLPVIGAPRQAEASTSEEEQQVNPDVLPSEDIAVGLKIPVLTPAPSVLGKQVRQTLLIVGPALLILLAIYVTYPAFAKARRRSRRREAALNAGPRARISLSYREWRDTCSDFACGSRSDTPIMFLSKFPPDEEHREFAWLVTRALWGDLSDDVNEELAASAEELSRSLRRRLAQSQSATIRAVAFVSRLSLRDPFGKDDAYKQLEYDRAA